MSYYRQIDGVKVDGALFDAAPDEWSLRGVIEFLRFVTDGSRYTPTEYATIELVSRRPGTPNSKAWLRSFLKSYNPADWPKKSAKKSSSKVAAKSAKKPAKKKSAKKKAAKKKAAKKKAAKKKASARKRGAEAKKRTGEKNGRQQRIPGT